MVEAIPETASDSDLPSCGELARLAEARSRVYGFLAAAYNYRPDRQLVDALLRPGIVALLDSFFHEADGLHQDVRDGLRLIRSYVKDAQTKPSEEILTELGVERTRLLRGVKPGYSPPPPYESVYCAPEHLARESAPTETVPYLAVAVKKAYEAAGLALSRDVADQPDFIGIELEFMRHMTEREARAWRLRAETEALACREEQWRFMEGHITRWVPRFCSVMEKESRLDFYRGLARLTRGMVEQDFTWLGSTCSGAPPKEG